MDVSSIEGDHRSSVATAGGQDLDAFSIRGDLWFVADGNRPNRQSGAGRGMKQLVVIENSRLEIFSSSSDQARMLKGLTMRNIRRVSWFVHDPPTPSAPVDGGVKGTALRGGRGKAAIASAVGRTASAGGAPRGSTAPAPPLPRYYYLIVETAVQQLASGGDASVLPRNDRLVFCTDHQPDFQVWMQFFDQLGPGVQLDDYFDGRSTSAAMSAADGGESFHSVQRMHDSRSTQHDYHPASTAAAPREAQFKSEVDKLSSFAAEWKSRAVELFTSVRELMHSATSPSANNSGLRSGGAGFTVGALTDDWRAHTTTLLAQLKETCVDSSNAPSLGLQHTQAFEAARVVGDPTAAAVHGGDIDMLETKVANLQRLVNHYVRTETAACDVINDFDRRNRSVLPPHADTPGKLRYAFGHMTKKLSAAWVTLSSMPRSTSSVSNQSPTPRSHSLDTAGGGSHRKQLHHLHQHGGFVPADDVDPALHGASVHLNVSTGELIALVEHVRGLLARAQAQGLFVPDATQPSLAQQLDVVMQQIATVDVDAARAEAERLLSTKTEYLLSEIARLRSMLEEKERRIAETDDAMSRLEEEANALSRAAGRRRGAPSASPPRESSALRDTERAVMELLRSLDQQGIRLPSGSNAVKLRYAFESLFFNTVPLMHQIISPEEVHGLKQLMEQQSHTIRRLERRLQEQKRIQDDLLSSHHHPNDAGSPSRGSAAVPPPTTGPLAEPATATAARQIANLSSILHDKEEQLDILNKELHSAKEVEGITFTIGGLRAEVDHWKLRCNRLEQELLKRGGIDLTPSRSQSLQAGAVDASTNGESVQRALLGPLDAVATAEAKGDQYPSRELAEALERIALLEQTLLNRSATTSTSSPAAHVAPQSDEVQRFVQLLTMKNRQITALQSHVTHLLQVQEEAATLQRRQLPSSVPSPVQPPEPAAASPRTPLAGRRASAATSTAPQQDAPPPLHKLSEPFSDTEQAALVLLEQAEAEHDLTLPRGSTAVRLRYLFETLGRQAQPHHQRIPSVSATSLTASSAHADALLTSVVLLSEAMGEPVAIESLVDEEPQYVSEALQMIVDRATAAIQRQAEAGGDSPINPGVSAARADDDSEEGQGAEAQTKRLASSLLEDRQRSGSSNDVALPLAEDTSSGAATATARRASVMGASSKRVVATKQKPPMAAADSTGGAGGAVQTPYALPKVASSGSGSRTVEADVVDAVNQKLQAMLLKHSKLTASALASSDIHDTIRQLDVLVKRLATSATSATGVESSRRSSTPASPPAAAAAAPPQVEAQRDLSALEHSAIDAITDMTLANEEEDGGNDPPSVDPPQQLRNGVQSLLKHVERLKNEAKMVRMTEGDVRRELVVARSELSKLTLQATELEGQRDAASMEARSVQRTLKRALEELAELHLSAKRTLSSLLTEALRLAHVMHREGIREASFSSIGTSSGTSVALLQDELAGARRQCEELQTHWSQQQEALEAANASLRSLRERNRMLDGRVEECEAEIADLTRNLKSAVSTQASAGSESARVIDTLQQQLDESQASARRFAGDNQRLQEQLDAQAATLQALQHTIDRDVEATRREQGAQQDAVNSMSQELITLRLSRDRDIAHLKEAQERAKKHWDLEAQAMQARIDALQRAAAGGRDVTVLCIPSDTASSSQHQALAAAASPLLSASTSQRSHSQAGGLEHYHAFSDEPFGQTVSSTGFSSTNNLQNSTRSASMLHAQQAGRTTDEGEAGLAASTNLSTSSHLDDVVAVLGQLCGVRAAGASRQATIGKLKAFASWCHERVVPFAFSANAQCQSILESIVWAVEGYMRLLHSASPLFALTGNSKSSTYIADVGLGRRSSSVANDGSELFADSGAPSNVAAPEFIAWRIRELSEEHDALCCALASANEIVAAIDGTASVSSPAASPNRSSSRRVTITTGSGAATSFATTTASARETVHALVHCCEVVRRVMQSAQANSLHALEQQLLTAFRKAEAMDDLQRTIQSLPSLLQESPLLSSDVMQRLRGVNVGHAATCIQDVAQEIAALLAVVQDSIATNVGADAVGGIIPCGPEPLRLALGSIAHLQAELERSRNDLRHTLGSMSDHHAQEIGDAIKGKQASDAALQNVQAALQTEIEARTAAETDARRAKEERDNLQEDADRAHERFEDASLRVQELELQLRRCEIDSTETLKVLGAVFDPGAGNQRPSLIAVATTTAERLRELELAINEAGWAIRPSSTRSGSILTTGAGAAAPSRRSFFAGASTASGSPDRPPFVFPPQSDTGSRSPPERRASSMRRTSYFAASPVDDANESLDEGNSTSIASPTANTLVQLCRAAAAENQALRGERDVLTRASSTMRTGLEDVAFHLRVEGDDLRNPDTSVFLSAVPRVVAAAQATRQSSEAALQDSKHMTSTVQSTASKLQESETELQNTRDQLEEALRTAQASEKEWSSRLRDTKKDLDEWRRSAEDALDELERLRVSSTSEIGMLQQACAEAQMARQSLSEELSRVGSQSSETAEVLQAALKETTAQRDVLHRKFEALSKEQQEALGTAAATGNALRSVAELGAAFDRVCTVHDCVEVEYAETSARRVMELRWAQEQLGCWAALSDYIRCAVTTVSILAVPSVDVVPDAVRALQKSESTLRALCGDPTVGRKEPATRAECITAIREVLPIVRTAVAPAPALPQESRDAVAGVDSPPRTSGTAPPLPLTQELIDGCTAMAHELDALRTALAHHIAEGRSMREELRRQCMGADDAVSQRNTTHDALSRALVDLEESVQRRTLEHRFRDSIATTVTACCSVALHQSAQAATLLQPCPTVELVVVRLGELMQSEATALALLGDNSAAFRRDAAVTRSDCLRAMHEAIGALGCAIPDGSNVASALELAAREVADRVRDATSELHRVGAELATTSMARDALDDRAQLLQAALTDAQKQCGALSLALEELAGRRQLELRAGESVPIQEHILHAAHACAAACVGIARLDAAVAVGVAGLPSAVDDLVAAHAQLSALVGDVTVGRRDSSSRSRCLVAVREATHILGGADSELDAPGALLESAKAAAEELRVLDDRMRVLLPEARKAQEDVKHLGASLKNTQHALEASQSALAMASLEHAECLERLRIESRMWEVTDISPLVCAASVGWQAASTVASPSLDEAANDVRGLSASEMQLRALAGDLNLARDTPTDVSRSSCIAAIMQAIAVLGADVKGDILSSLLSAAAAAATVVNDAQTKIPAMSGELRKLKEDHRTLKQQYQNMDEDAKRLKASREFMVLHQQELQGRRLLESQKNMEAWELLMPVVASVSSRAIHAASIVAAGSIADLPRAAAAVVHERNSLSTLVGDASFCATTDGSRSDLLAVVAESIEALGAELPRHNWATTLLSSCRSARRQTEGDAIAIQTITADLKRTKEELSTYAVAALSAREQASAVGIVAASHRLELDELAARLALVSTWASSGVHPHIESLVSVHNDAARSASALGVPLSQLLREVHRISDEHVIFSGMVGETDVATHLGTRSELAHVVLRASDILQSIVAQRRSSTLQQRRGYHSASPERDASAETLIQLCHDVVDALALARANIRTLENTNSTLVDDTHELLGTVAASCATLRSTLLPTAAAVSASSVRLGSATPPRLSSPSLVDDSNSNVKGRRTPRQQRSTSSMMSVPLSGVRALLDDGWQSGDDQAAAGTMQSEQQLSHLHRSVLAASSDLERAAKEATNHSQGLSAILRTACEVLRDIDRSKQLGSSGADTLVPRDSTTMDVIELTSLCHATAQEVDQLRDGTVLLSADLSETAMQASKLRVFLKQVCTIVAVALHDNSIHPVDDDEGASEDGVASVDNLGASVLRAVEAMSQQFTILVQQQETMEAQLDRHSSKTTGRFEGSTTASTSVGVVAKLGDAISLAEETREALAEERRIVRSLQERISDTELAASHDRELLESQANNLQAELLKVRDEGHVFHRRLQTAQHRIAALEGVVAETIHAARLSAAHRQSLSISRITAEDDDDHERSLAGGDSTQQGVAPHDRSSDDLIVTARHAADAVGEALRSNDILAADIRNLKLQISHGQERCAHAEGEIAQLHQRLEQSASQFAALQQEDALRARELRTVSELLDQARDSTAALEKALAAQQHEAATHLQDVLRHHDEALAAQAAQFGKLETELRTDVAAHVDQNNMLAAELAALQATADSGTASLRRMFVRLRRDSVEGCIELYDDLMHAQQQLGLALEESARRVRIMLATPPLPPQLRKMLSGAAWDQMACASTLHLADPTELPIKVHHLHNAHTELAALCGDLTVGRSGPVVTRSEAMISILHAMSVLTDDGDDTDRQHTNTATTSLCDRLVAMVTDSVERSVGMRSELAQLQRNVHELRDKLSLGANAMVAALMALRRANSGAQSDTAINFGTSASIVGIATALDAAVRDTCDRVEQYRDVMHQVAASLACVKTVGDGPSSSALPATVDHTLPHASRVAAEELLHLRQRRRDLEARQEQLVAERDALYQSVVASVSVLPRTYAAHATPSSVDTSIASTVPSTEGGDATDDDATAMAVAKLLEVRAADVQLAQRGSNKALTEAVAVLCDGFNDGTDSMQRAAGLCKSGQDKRALVVALATTASDVFESTKEALAQHTAQLRRSEQRNEQLQKEIAAAAARHNEAIAELEQARDTEHGRWSANVERLKDLSATQRQQLTKLEETLGSVAAVLRVDASDAEQLVEQAGSLRASHEALQQQHKKLASAHKDLSEQEKTATRAVEELTHTLERLQEELLQLRRTSTAQQEGQTRAQQALEVELSETKTEVEGLQASLQDAKATLVRTREEFHEQFTRTSEMHAAEIELLQSRLRDREDAFIVKDSESQGAHHELRLVEYRVESFCKRLDVGSLDDVAAKVVDLRHALEQLMLINDAANARIQLVTRCMEQQQSLVAGYTSSSMRAVAEAASLIGQDANVATLAQHTQVLLREHAAASELLGEATVSQRGRGITTSRAQLVESTLSAIRRLADAQRPDAVAGSDASETLYRGDIHLLLDGSVRNCVEELQELRAALLARMTDVKRLFEEQQVASTAAQTSLASLKQARRNYVENAAVLTSSPNKQPVVDGTGVDASSSSSLVRPLFPDADALDAGLLAQAAWKELPGEAKEAADRLNQANQRLLQASCVLVPIALPHLRSSSLVVGSPVSAAFSPATLVDNIVLASQRAANELTTLRDEKSALLEEVGSLKSVVDAYLAAVKPAVRSFAMVGCQAQSLNESFNVALPEEAGVGRGGDVSREDNSPSVTQLSHAALCEDLTDTAHNIINELKKTRRCIREAHDVLQPVVHSGTTVMSEAQQESVNVSAAMAPNEPEALSAVAVMAAEQLLQIRHNVESLSQSLKKAEAKLEATRGELRATQESLESETVAGEMRAVALEQAHKVVLDGFKDTQQSLHQELTSLKRFVSDIAHIGDVHEEWDAPIEFLSTVTTRVETVFKQLEQAQQSIKHFTAEVKNAKAKEGDLQSNRTILESQLDQVSTELEETQRQQSLRSREHKKELELLNRAIEETQQELRDAQQDGLAKHDAIERLQGEVERLKAAHRDALAVQSNAAQEEATLLHEDIRLSNEARQVLTTRLEAFQANLSALLRHLACDTVEAAHVQWDAAQSHILALQTERDEATGRRVLEAKEQHHLIHASQWFTTVLHGHALTTTAASILGADFDNFETLLRALVDSEARLQDLQGDPASAKKSDATRSAMIDALLDCRMYLGLPLYDDGSSNDNAVATVTSGTSAAVGSLVERHAALSAQLRLTTENLQTTSDALMRLTDAATSATIILLGPQELASLSPTPRGSGTPGGHASTTRTATHVAASLERAAQVSAEKARQMKTSINTALHTFGVLAAGAATTAPLHAAPGLAAAAMPSTPTASPSSTSGAVTGHSHGSSFLGTPKRNNAHPPQYSGDICNALDSGVERLCREVSALRTTVQLQKDELDSLGERCHVFDTQMPPLIKLLSVALATASTATATTTTTSTSTTATSGVSDEPSTATAICVRLHNQVQQVVDEWSRTQKLLSDAVQQLSSIPGVSSSPGGRTGGSTGVNILAASVADVVRQQASMLDQRQSQIKKLENRMEMLNNDVRLLNEQHDEATAKQHHDAQAVQRQLQQALDGLREQNTVQAHTVQRLHTFVSDVSTALHVELPADAADTVTATPSALSAVVRAATAVRTSAEQLQQQLRRQVARCEDTELDVDKHKTEARESRERAEHLVAQLQALQLEHDAASKKHRNDMTQKQNELDEALRLMQSERRERDMRLGEAASQHADAHSALLRIVDVCSQSGDERSEETSTATLVERCILRFRALSNEVKTTRDALETLHAEHAKATAKHQSDVAAIRTDLDRATAECTDRRSREATVIQQLESLLETHSELVTSWLPNDEPFTIIGIATMSLAQVVRRQKLLDIAERAKHQLEVEAAKMSAQLASYREENRRLSNEQQELRTEMAALQKTFHASEVGASAIGAELHAVKQQVHKVFVSACNYAQKDLRMPTTVVTASAPTAAEGGEPLSTSQTQTESRSTAGELTMVQSILQHIATRYRNAPTTDELHALKTDHMNALAEERGKRVSAERLHSFVEDKLLPMLLPPPLPQADAPTTSALPLRTGEVLEATTKLQDNLVAAVLTLGDCIDVESSAVKKSSVFALSGMVLEAVTALKQRYVRVVEMGNSIADALHATKLDVAHPSRSVADASRRWAESILDAARRLDSDADQFSDRLVDLMKQFGAAVPLPLHLQDSRLFATQQTPPAGHGVSAIMAAPTPATTSAERRTLILKALNDYFRNVVAQNIHLTSEWQALGDQNNRLMLERRELREERDQIQQHVTELRKAVRRKINDDQLVEQQLLSLDQHLEMQARELAFKYQADRDIIQRRFAELKSVIHSTVVAQHRAPSAATSDRATSHQQSLRNVSTISSRSNSGAH